MSYEYGSLIAGAVIEDVALSKRRKNSMLMELNEVYWKAELFNEINDIVFKAYPQHELRDKVLSILIKYESEAD